MIRPKKVNNVMDDLCLLKYCQIHRVQLFGSDRKSKIKRKNYLDLFWQYQKMKLMNVETQTGQSACLCTARILVFSSD